ncbi:hypothetical protein DL96DRAFT_1552619 [Flagelloscypha sp. PMI_526]|nr:hypothetical protein DL96DRAFT_1552619 [Flagelloscypha sp. PMI_526]
MKTESEYMSMNITALISDKDVMKIINEKPNDLPMLLMLDEEEEAKESVAAASSWRLVYLGFAPLAKRGKSGHYDNGEEDVSEDNIVDPEEDIEGEDDLATYEQGDLKGKKRVKEQ